MATWSSENVVLTEKGNEILSKVQAGVGGITVTRIVTGSTIIPYAQLHKSLAIPGIRQECNILSVSTDMNGSEISVSVSNETLEESYSLYTLGVYVTHPDFPEEVLYMVAECDITNPDVVPLPSVTVATMYYSLYMAHTNTDNITIEVNPGNSVTIDMIGKPGGIASLDSKGKIPNEQLPPMDYIPLSQKGVSGGVATLDESGKVPASQIPEVKMDYEPLGSINTHDKDPEAHEPVRRDFNNKVNGLALKISSLESFLYNDLKTNPHSMSFEDLGGVTVTGYWNKSASTLEC